MVLLVCLVMFLISETANLSVSKLKKSLDNDEIAMLIVEGDKTVYSLLMDKSGKVAYKPIATKERLTQLTETPGTIYVDADAVGKLFDSIIPLITKKELYLNGPYEVSVLVREQAVPSLREQYALKKMIENIQPAHIRMHLIILRPGIYLGQNVYAGVNSMLVAYEHANLNGVAAIPSIVGAAEAGAEEEKKDEEFEKLSI